MIRYVYCTWQHHVKTNILPFLFRLDFVGEKKNESVDWPGIQGREKKSRSTHDFDVFMRSIENLGFSKANFKIVHSQLFHPYGHGVLGSHGVLVSNTYKDAWGS